MEQPDDQSVRHLVELGYADPDEAAARHAAMRRQQEAELRRAAELASSGQLNDAAAVSEKLVAADSNWAAPRQLLAEVFYRQGHLREAQLQLDWLTYHGTEHPRLALIAGAIALTRRDLQPAMELLEYARHIDPTLPSVHTLYGYALLRLGNLDDAADAFRCAAEHSPTDARALDGLAAVCLRAGQFEEAADWALQALEQNIQLFHAHYHLGLALKRLGRHNDAIQALETSARVDRLRSAPYYCLSRLAELHLKNPSLAAGYRKQGRDVVRERRARRSKAKERANPVHPLTRSVSEEKPTN
jgi:tetratricopeptide (TPR) repeat protein